MRHAATVPCSSSASKTGQSLQLMAELGTPVRLRTTTQPHAPVQHGLECIGQDASGAAEPYCHPDTTAQRVKDTNRQTTSYSPAQHGLEHLGQEAALHDEPLRAVQAAAGAQLRKQELLHGWEGSGGCSEATLAQQLLWVTARRHVLVVARAHGGLHFAITGPSDKTAAPSSKQRVRSAAKSSVTDVRSSPSPARARGCGSSTCTAP